MSQAAATTPTAAAGAVPFERDVAPRNQTRPEAPAANAAREREDVRNVRALLAQVKGQTQFLLYLADQIEESLEQLPADDRPENERDRDSDPAQTAFLCKILNMYAAQLETKHRAAGEAVAETTRNVFKIIREREGF